MRLLFSILIFLVLIVSAVLFYVDYGPVSVLPILRYEHVAESEGKAPDYIHPRAFARQMKHLADDKFKVVGLDEVVRIYREGGKIPRHTIAITFDGGYDDFYDFAASILWNYKFPATVFLQSGNVGKKGYMTKDQVLDVVGRGITLGSNGQTGRELTSLSGSDAYNEIFSSRTSLEKELRVPVYFLSYPEGRVSPVLERLAKESGYKGACALMPGKKFPAKDPLMMKRIPILPSDDNPILFKLKTWGNYVLFKEWWEGRKIKNQKSKIKN